eukprot:TRINITY_DN35789_c0_g1_i1.p1 TRINITY_DN35789_c0_g1~~TRINITY_DN35789_c0_g1_i1.p1  ORF type:complete len:151 (-),score=63.15 TRINITY_DN35789_c0_g1_i1:186-638(-)
MLGSATRLLCAEYGQAARVYEDLVHDCLEQCEQRALCCVHQEVLEALEVLFHTQDTEHLGCIASHEQLSALCTAVLYQYCDHVTFPASQHVQQLCCEQALGPGTQPWSFEQFKTWFVQRVMGRSELEGTQQHRPQALATDKETMAGPNIR